MSDSRPRRTRNFDLRFGGRVLALEWGADVTESNFGRDLIKAQVGRISPCDEIWIWLSAGKWLEAVPEGQTRPRTCRTSLRQNQENLRRSGNTIGMGWHVYG